MSHGFRTWIAESKDRLLASDPGLGRLRTGLSAAVAMGAALAVEYAFATMHGVTGPARFMAMLLGAVVAMMGSMALTGTGFWRKVRLAVFFPVAIGAGLLLGAAVDRRHDLMLVGFVVVMFIAVFVRRFGLPFFHYGFMLWNGYFFAAFLKLTYASVPPLLVAVAIGSVTVLVLSVTVLGTNPRTVLRSTWRAYLARGRALARACAALLEPGQVPEGKALARRLRRVAARQAGVAEAALMVEGWSEERGALAPRWSGPALRRHAIDVQQTLDRIANASAALVGCDPALVAGAYEVVEELSHGHDAAAALAAARLDVLACTCDHEHTAGGRKARQLVVATQEYVELVRQDPEPPEVDGGQEEFTATAPLMMGNLPGSPAVARDVTARGSRWNPLARLDLTTRQAVQASLAGGLAILLGTQVSPSRYYWAVITAFVVFTGTGTRSETFLKAMNRVVGTLLGLVAAIWLAHLTNGDTMGILVVVLVSVFLAFYLMRVSYGYMMFFFTIMLGQLYSALGQFSSDLLVLRLEETVVGAAIGVLVALMVTPVSTRDAVRTARDNLFDALGDLLAGIAAWLDGERPRPDLDGLVRGFDNRVREVHLVAKPLTRPLVWGNDSPRTRHRLRLYSGMAADLRTLVGGLRRCADMDRHRVAQACASLAEAAVSLKGATPDTQVTKLQGPLDTAEQMLLAEHPDASGELVLRPLLHLYRTLGELAGASQERQPTPIQEQIGSPA